MNIISKFSPLKDRVSWPHERFGRERRKTKDVCVCVCVRVYALGRNEHLIGLKTGFTISRFDSFGKLRTCVCVCVCETLVEFKVKISN